MTEQDFIDKWTSGQEGEWWLQNAYSAFWAVSYQMPKDKLLEMSRDFLSIPGNEDPSRWGSSIDKARDVIWHHENPGAP